MRRFSLLPAIPIALLVLASCAGGHLTSVPTSPSLCFQQPAAPAADECLWGLWDVYIDLENSTAEAVPLRGAEFTCNVIRYVETPPHYLHLSGLYATPHDGYVDIDIDVGIEHPFPGLSAFIGFDVMGVFLGEVSGTYHGTSELSVATTEDPQLINADGYTRWFNGPEFYEAGQVKPLFGYHPGVQGTLDFFPDGTLNPYKYFCDALFPADSQTPYEALCIPSGLRGSFTPGSLNWRHYTIRRPVAKTVRFQYAVIAHWEPNINHPDPPGGFEDFPLSANADEAVAISVVDSSDLFYDPSSSGGNVVLDISPWDWSSTWDGYVPEYDIRLFSSAWDGPYNVDMTPSQIIGKIVVFHAEFPVGMLTSADPLTVWIEVAYPSLDYTTHLEIPNDANGELTSYFRIEIPVEPAPTFITVLVPNGGETWSVGSNEEISWASSGDIANVNIEYSKDDFASDVNLIVWNEPNVGSFLWENIPNDPTTNATVRVTSTANPLIFDISDGPFTIVAPDCAPEDHFEIEPNNSSETATPMGWDYAPEADGFGHTGQICPDADVDYYAIELTSGQGSFLVTCLDLGQDQVLDLQLFDGVGSLVDATLLPEGQFAETVRIPVLGPLGTYRLRIAATGGGNPEYDVHPLRWPNWNEGFSFYETESNDSSPSADAMAIDYDPDTDSFQYTGEQAGGDSDWFSINTAADGILIIHMSDYDNASNEEEYFTLYNGSLGQLDTGTIWYQDGSAFISSGGVVTAGTYYVEVSANTFTHRYVLEPNLVTE